LIFHTETNVMAALGDQEPNQVFSGIPSCFFPFPFVFPTDPFRTYRWRLEYSSTVVGSGTYQSSMTFCFWWFGLLSFSGSESKPTNKKGTNQPYLFGNKSRLTKNTDACNQAGRVLFS